MKHKIFEENFRAYMLSIIKQYITSSKDDRSISEHATEVLNTYIKNTVQHIDLVKECGGILMEKVTELQEDAEQFKTNLEFHDHDKLNDPKIIPIYAIGCYVLYFNNEEIPFEYSKGIETTFEELAWPRHYKNNQHHVAEHYGSKEGGIWVVDKQAPILAVAEMVADWMAMGITHGDSANAWWNKTKDKKWKFDPASTELIEIFLKVEEESQKQLNWIKRFKLPAINMFANISPLKGDTPATTESEPSEDVNPIENKGVNDTTDVKAYEDFHIEPIVVDNETDDDLSELDDYLEEVNKLVAEMEPWEMPHHVGQFKDVTLHIGKISEKDIDMDKVRELMRYHKYLDTLKKWCTYPDYTLLPDLIKFGSIVDRIYKFNKPITAYRAIRVGELNANKSQHDMGLVDVSPLETSEGPEMILKTPKPEVKEGYTFDYTTDGPLSVSRTIWIVRVYGDLLLKTVVPPTAKKLVITNELAYILQKLEVQYFSYRPINLSSRTEIILFPNQTFKFEVVSTDGDISNEIPELAKGSLEGWGGDKPWNPKDDEDPPEAHTGASWWEDLKSAFIGRKPYDDIFEDLYATQKGSIAFKRALQATIKTYTALLKQDANRMLTTACLWLSHHSNDDFANLPSAKKEAEQLGLKIYPMFDESVLDFKRGKVTLATRGAKERIPLMNSRKNAIIKLWKTLSELYEKAIVVQRTAKNGKTDDSIEKQYVQAAKEVLDLRIKQMSDQRAQFDKIQKLIVAEYTKEVENLKRQLKEYHSEQKTKDSSNEAIVPFINTSAYKQITDLAKPCYKPVGQNSWEHIQQVYSQASRICKKLFNRTLTPVEYAACLFHDCSVIDSGKDNHNQLSADKAVGILKDLFTPEELNIIHTAIVEHDNQVTIGQWKFSSSASEFVAAGDFNPPDAEWIMNKSYTWGITHGLDHAERIANMTALVKRAYSSTGEMWLHMPNVYKNYFASKINAVKKLFDKITLEEAEKMVMTYRKKHHLSDTDINLPSSSVEALSTKEWAESDINSVDDLKQFYKHCSYGLIDFKANKPWKETHQNTTFEDWEKEWRLLSVEQLLKFKCGICYDTAKANDYFLTKWKIEHINLFAYTKRSAGDDYDDDPTHTFTVYKDTDGKWKWLEGSWGSFKNNDWSESSSDALIKNIGKALANEAGVTNLIGVITSWPRDGVSMNEFYHALKDQAIKRYKYEIKPDVSYSKETLSSDQLKNIGNELYHGSPEDKDQLSGYSRAKQYKNSVFLSPLKGIASLFIISTNDKYGPNHGYQNIHWKYDAWSMSTSSLTSPRKHVIIYHNAKNFEDHSGESEGYLYTVKVTEDVKNHLKLFGSGDTQREVRYESTTPLQYSKKEKITITWETKYDPSMEKEYGAAVEQLTSTEALVPKDISKKKAAIIKYICDVCDILDPSKTNSKRYHRILDHMTDKEFDQWMNYVKDGKWQIHIVAPNMIVNLRNENILKAADKVGCKLFHRLWINDPTTGRKYLTDNEYLILNLPVRRQQQFLDEKMSVPEHDRTIDGMTGQVTGDSRACSVTNPEIQILAARGLDATLEEFVNVRGGNMHAYAEFRRQAEETGEISLNSLDPNTRSRVAVVGQVLVNSMMLDTNIVE